ncbi:molybdopterin-dependent oxidoreductase [Chloroflexota bacterium]
MSTSKTVTTEQEVIKEGLCYMCTDRCPTKVHVSNGKATKIDMVNKKADYCPRWKAQLDFVYHPDRLKYPLKRTGERGEGSFTRISWDEALDTVASNLQKVKDEYGPESVVFYISYTKEPRPYFHRLTHGFGSPNYCTESSNCFSGTWTAANVTYGPDYGWLYANSKKVDPASKCKLVWGSSVYNCSPSVWKDHVEAKNNGIPLIVVDPRRTALASMADIHLQIRPGTDGALALGMMNVIISENLHDREFMEKWTVGFNELKELVKEYPLELVEGITWVPADKINKAAILYATLKPAKLGMSGNSTTHHTNGVQNHRAIILLPALTGNLEIAGGNRWAPSRPEIISLNDITLHERVENMPPGVGAKRFPIWTKRYKEMQSNTIADHIDSGDPYPIKAIYSSGLNITFFPNSNRFLENMKRLDFIAVNEYFHTPTTRYADIVLPIATWLERHILLTDIPGYVKLIQPAIEPIGECRPEWDIYADLARRLGFGDEFWDGDYNKCHNYLLEPAGISMEELRQHPEGIPNPVPPRPERNYEKTGFNTPSGKIEIISSVLEEHGQEPLPVYNEPPESPMSRADLTTTYPLVLTSGARILAYTHSQFRNIAQLHKMMPELLVDINPSDANFRCIQTGDTVTVSSTRGSIKIKANVTDTILPGVVSIPHEWPADDTVNILIDDQNLDPISGFAPFKSQLCQVAKC